MGASLPGWTEDGSQGGELSKQAQLSLRIEAGLGVRETRGRREAVFKVGDLCIWSPAGRVQGGGKNRVLEDDRVGAKQESPEGHSH